ncbi:MAG: hypothetical protein LUD12_06395 [Lachnospiraceae bacterium]|nr:hypothetical protein [Lachnospiraceae bacterium]
MNQDRHSYYRREREYQRRQSEIEAKRKKTLTKQAAVLVLVLFVVCVFLGDFLSDQTHMAHWLSIYGVSVSGMTTEKAAQKLEKNLERRNWFLLKTGRSSTG